MANNDGCKDSGVNSGGSGSGGRGIQEMKLAINFHAMEDRHKHPIESGRDRRITSFLNQNPACASCRYQRRKCTPDCPMAPFFPPDRMSDFLNVQRLFGVSNVIKLISKFGKPDERAAAMRSIKQEAKVRARDPILGSYGIVLELNKHILHARTLLNNLCQQLTFCRAQHHRHLHGDSSFGTNSMHAPPPPPLLSQPPPAPA
ncbi:LOB domain-containing protein 22 [Amborella trichopoda]|nr:LOB domain-containing protein 22 [Amborella trichopoda]|eukprot:XP_006853821.2 LOB domain-containing protein 22 [Amborella trichopoda]